LESANPALAGGVRLFSWIAERHREGVRVFRDLLPPPQTVVDLPLLDSEPTDFASVDALSRTIEQRFAAVAGALVAHRS
jgi:hypothetical protein